MLQAMVDNHNAYRRQMGHGRNLRRGAAPMLERRTVWRDRSSSPTVSRDQYGKGSTHGCYQKRPERRESFTINESSLPIRHQRHGRRERLSNNSELRRSSISRISPTSVRTGPMEDHKYLESELTKQSWLRDRFIAQERPRNEGIRSPDAINRNSNRIQPSEYGSERVLNCHVQFESQRASEEIAGKSTNVMTNWRIEDLLGGQSMLNTHSIQNAQAWIANDSSLSQAQVARARELLQELLITITTKPEDRPPNFVADRRILDYIPSRSFSQHNIQSALYSDSAVHGRELSVIQNPLPVNLPLTLSTQNWRNDRPGLCSSEVPMSSRDLPKNLEFPGCGSRNDCPNPYVENPELAKRNGRGHELNLLGSEKRKSHFHGRRRLSKSRSRSLGKDCDTDFGERRVHLKSHDLISVRINQTQKESRRNCLPYETHRSHHRGSRDERSSRCSSHLTRSMARDKP